MAETEFEKWLAMKAGKRKKQTGRGKEKESSIRKKKDSRSKLAKQPTKDLKASVKHLTAEGLLKSAESITVSQDLNIQRKTEMDSGTAPISAKFATRRLRSRRRRERSKKESSLNS